MLMRVILGPDNIQKLSIPSTPSSLEELKDVLCDKLQIDKGFSLQYKDPDFDNSLCNLMDIKELPADKVTLKVLWKVVFTPAKDEASLSDFTVNTASVSSRTSSSASSCHRAEQWPAVFPIPVFSYDVEFRLQKENEVYEKTGKSALIVSREIKMEVLDKVAEHMYSFKAYPTDADFESVAAALVRKHPCLKEPGPGTGWQGWKMSLKYKMGNYRQKLRTAGCLEVSVNKREKETPQRGVKRPRRSEINFLPDRPHGFDDEALERERITLVEELRKKNVNMTLVNQKMDMTFSMRRREIVQDKPLVSVLMERWPGLFTEPQVYAEFKRITGIDLHTAFHASLDKFSAPLLKMYRAKESNTITALLESLDEQTTDMTKHRRITALKGLPYYLREHTPILKTCVAADLLEAKVAMKMGILETIEDGAVSHKSVNNIIVLEEIVVLEGLADYPTAFGLLFGLIYALNIEFPKEWKYSFETIQKVFLFLGEKCSSRTLSLKNRLLKS